MKETYPVGCIVIIAILVLIGLALLVWGTVLIVNPDTRFEGIVVFLIFIPDFLAICFFWTLPQQKD